MVNGLFEDFLLEGMLASLRFVDLHSKTRLLDRVSIPKTRLH